MSRTPHTARRATSSRLSVAASPESGIRDLSETGVARLNFISTRLEYPMCKPVCPVSLCTQVGGVGRGLCVDVSRVHDFHGNAANQSLNGTLRHADINQVLSHRAQEKINKYRAGYAALDVRRAFLPAVVSTSGRIHGDLLRLLYLLADNKTKRHFRDRHEAIDDDSEAYCWRRSGFFWRMRASLGLACAQATTLAAQVFGQGNPRSRAGRTSA